MKICLIFVPPPVSRFFQDTSCVHASVSSVEWTPMSDIFSAWQHAERAICYRPSFCPSVCLSVTRVDQSKTVARIIEILSPSDRPNALVFRHQRSLRKSDGFTPNGGAKYKGVAKTSNFSTNMRLYLYIWKTNIKSYVLYRLVPLTMTLSDPEASFKVTV